MTYRAHTYSIFKMQLHSVNKLAFVPTLKSHFPPTHSRSRHGASDL